MAGLYIHIPFCKRRCHYCDFFSTTLSGRWEEYVGALTGEMDRERNFLGDERLETIYFGGGTPSLLPVQGVADILGAVARLWDTGGLGEITFEANPDDLTPQYLGELRRLGINRLSIGIQSLDDDILRLLGRRHTSGAALQAIRDARRAGFENLSADLIYGIPGLDESRWADSVDRLVDAGVEHISAYHLTIEPGTEFARRGLQPVCEETGQKQYQILCEKLSAAGYEHYEISNFALPSRHARHNSSYWSGESYLGLGPSAHSYDGKGVRRWSAPSLDEYLIAPRYESETLSQDNRYNEYVMTGLRTARGVEPAVIAQKFGAHKLHYFNTCAAPFLVAGTLVGHGERVALPPEKFFISDAVISSLFT